MLRIIVFIVFYVLTTIASIDNDLEECKNPIFQAVPLDQLEIKNSTVQGAGLGLFTKVFIPKGKVVWNGANNMIIISPTAYKSLVGSVANELAYHFQRAINTFAYCEVSKEYPDGFLAFATDIHKYTNHLDPSNIGYNEYRTPLVSVALRDIQAGEEIFEEYSTWDHICDQWAPEMTEYNIEDWYKSGAE
jgi:hypothetical protein